MSERGGEKRRRGAEDGAAAESSEKSTISFIDNLKMWVRGNHVAGQFRVDEIEAFLLAVKEDIACTRTPTQDETYERMVDVFVMACRKTDLDDDYASELALRLAFCMDPIRSEAIQRPPDTPSVIWYWVGSSYDFTKRIAMKMYISKHADERLKLMNFLGQVTRSIRQSAQTDDPLVEDVRAAVCDSDQWMRAHSDAKFVYIRAALDWFDLDNVTFPDTRE